MRAWNHSEWTIFLIALVQMDTDGKHCFQYGRGRLHMDDAGFDRPWPKALDVDPFLHRYREFLMPRDFPIRVGRLVEERCANSKSRFSEDGIDKVANSGRGSEPRHLRK